MLWGCASRPCQTRDSPITRISAGSLWRRGVRHDDIFPLGERLNSPMDLLTYYLVRKKLCEFQHWQLNYTIASFTLTISRKRTFRLYESSMLVLSPIDHSCTQYLIIILNYSEMHGTISCLPAQTLSSQALSNLLVAWSLNMITKWCRFDFWIIMYLILSSLIRFQVNECATSYPRWIRTMTGVATPSVIFTFPPDIPLATYIQIIPDMVNLFNDVKWVVLSTDVHNVPSLIFHQWSLFILQRRNQSRGHQPHFVTRSTDRQIKTSVHEGPC